MGWDVVFWRKMRKDTDSMEEKVRAILEILENRYPESMCALHDDKD